VGRTDFVPERGEEGEAHGAPEHEVVDPVTQRTQYSDLVGDFRTAHHGDEGSSPIDQNAGERLDFALQ
jgi:hypothetical protein